MLEIIFIGISFNIFYPTYIWARFENFPTNDLFKKHLALSNIIFGITFLLIAFFQLPVALKITAFIFKIIYFLVSHRIYKKRTPKAKKIFLLSFLSIFLFIFIFHYIHRTPEYIFFLDKILRGAVISIIIFKINCFFPRQDLKNTSKG